jgi:TetR/AcrR family transcriptional regulator, cholesterol catabolism regulator
MTSSQRPSRKDEILMRAAELIATHGYDKASLRDLADSMDISKGTILHHFGTKDRLLERIHASYMTRRLAEANLILASVHTPSEQLAALIYQLMIAQQTDRFATVAFAREIVRFASDDVMTDVRRMRTSYSDLMKATIARGTRSGEFKAADPGIIALMIFGMCNWSWTWLDPDGALLPEQIAEIFARTVLDGIASDKATFAPDATAKVVRDAINAAATTPIAPAGA